MSFIKNFKSFLEKINIDYDKYRNSTITCKNGDTYLFSEITEERLKSFDWAYFLAKQNQIIMLDNSQNYTDSIKLIKAFQDGRLCTENGAVEYFENAANDFDIDLFEATKDMYCFIRYMFSGIFDNAKLMYLEDGSFENYLICMATVPHTNGLAEDFTKDIRKLAKKCGLYIFPITGAFPKRQVLSFDNVDVKYHDLCVIDGILTPKNSYNKDRNNELIAELNAKRRQHRLEQLNFVMSSRDEEKYARKAEKLYDAIKKYGLENISKDKPQLRIENFLIEVFKVILYKKWASYKNIAELEASYEYFYHLFDECNSVSDLPLKENLIFDIIDDIREYVQPE